MPYVPGVPGLPSLPGILGAPGSYSAPGSNGAAVALKTIGLDLQGKSGYNIEQTSGNSSYDSYLRMLDEVDAANRSGMTAREFAGSQGVTSTLTDAEAATSDASNYRMAEGKGKTKFTYKNNPMDNPKAAKDIVENPKAVYRYSPDPKSERIGKFAEFDLDKHGCRVKCARSKIAIS